MDLSNTVTASPANTNKHNSTTNKYSVPQTNIISMIKQLINAVSQFLQMCRNIRIKFLSWAYMYTILKFVGKHVIQTNPQERERERDQCVSVCVHCMCLCMCVCMHACVRECVCVWMHIFHESYSRNLQQTTLFLGDII